MPWLWYPVGTQTLSPKGLRAAFAVPQGRHTTQTPRCRGRCWAVPPDPHHPIATTVGCLGQEEGAGVLPPAAPCVSGEAQGCCWDCKTLAFMFEAGFCQRFQGTAVTNSLRTFSFSLKHCISEGPGVCCVGKNPSDSSGLWLSRAEILRSRDQPHHPGAALSWHGQTWPQEEDGAGMNTPSPL